MGIGYPTTAAARVIDEAVGVYHADFDPKDALAEAKRTIESCRDIPFTVTDMRGREYHFKLLPQVDSGSPDIVLWSFNSDGWACDNAFVAAHNAAVGISTCARTQRLRRAVAGSGCVETD